MTKTKIFQTALASATALAIVLGGLWISDSSSSAKTTQRSICVNKETRDLTLRKNCRPTENFLVEASVFTEGGKSAYETWLDLGNKGTQAQFIASLAGASGSSSSFNPLTNRRCADAVSLAENKFGKLIVFKEVWDYVEQNSGCRLSQSGRETNYSLPDLNDITTNFKVVVDSSSSTTVRRFNNRPAEYVVPIELEFTLNLKGGWIVCSPSHPLYGNTNFTTSAEFARWVELENSRIPGTSSYKLSTTAFIARYGIDLGRDGEEDFDGVDHIAVCKEDATSNLGWQLVRFFNYLNYQSPSVFTGQAIHYISEWGWE
jgi:hypothetical protein